MLTQTGVYKLGPENATLAVNTRRAGAAAKAGHDLVIYVTSWDGTLDVREDPRQITIELTADSTSLRVHKASGGMKALSGNEKAEIEQIITSDVLKGSAVVFRSTEVTAIDAGRLGVQGELELAGKSNSIAFEVTVDAEGHLSGNATVKQTDWGIKPYSTLFGTLKVVDEVEVVIEGSLPST